MPQIYECGTAPGSSRLPGGSGGKRRIYASDKVHARGQTLHVRVYLLVESLSSQASINFSGTTVPEQTQSSAPKKSKGFQANWPLLRKFETMVFACMLALLPFFAMKVVDVASTQLFVKNAAVDLVNDLNKAKTYAKEGGVNITIESRPSSNMGPPAYLIQDDQRTIEEIVLPKGVHVEGICKFDPSGKPTKASTFTITKGLKHMRVIVDEEGVISSP